MEREGATGEGFVFRDSDEAIIAYHNWSRSSSFTCCCSSRFIQQSNIYGRTKQEASLTTVGKIIFNEILPDSFPYINEPTEFNLQIETPDKYFIPGTVDAKEHFAEAELVEAI